MIGVLVGLLIGVIILFIFEIIDNLKKEKK